MIFSGNTKAGLKSDCLFDLESHFKTEFEEDTVQSTSNLKRMWDSNLAQIEHFWSTKWWVLAHVHAN